MVGENSGNLHLAGFTIMRHPEDVWLSDLSVITEPRNLQIWRHSVHLHSGSSQPQCFIMEVLQNTWIYTKQVLGLKTWTVKCDFWNQQPDEGGQGGLPSPETLHWNWAGCPSVTRTSRMGAMRTGAETWATVSTTSGTGRQSRRQKNIINDSIGDQSSYSSSLHCKVLDWIHLKTWLRQTFANQLHDLPFSM